MVIHKYTSDTNRLGSYPASTERLFDIISQRTNTARSSLCYAFFISLSFNNNRITLLIFYLDRRIMDGLILIVV